MRRPLSLVLTAVVATALLAGGCGSSKHKSAAAPKAPGPSSAVTSCQRVPEPSSRSPRKLHAPKRKLDPSKAYTATVVTSCGEFSIALDVKRAPRTTASFVSLAKQRFFDMLTFHRIVAGFVIQGGDPKGDGSGGPGYSVTEPPPADIRYARGVVAMAKSGQEPPGTSGSQFFVVTGADAGLPPDYALVGTVTKGLDVVQRIGSVATNPQTQKPLDPVVIEQFSVQQG